MLILYINEITFRHLTQLQNLLRDTVSISPQDEQTVDLICEGQVQARLIRLPDLSTKIGPCPVHPLTPREQTVMELLGQGVCNREISRTLGIAEKTVEKHVSNILRKLKLKSRAQVVRLVMEQNI